jgi:hypothetical protein
VAIAWVVAQGDECVPLGARRRDRLTGALGAAGVILNPETSPQSTKGAAAGEQHPAPPMADFDSERR